MEELKSYQSPAKASTKSATFGDMQSKWENLEKSREYEQKIAEGFAIAETYLVQNYLDRFSAGEIQSANKNVINVLTLRMYQVKKLVFDPTEQINDKLISVYSGLHNIRSAVAMIIKATPMGIEFYVATRSDSSAALAGETLKSTLKGNFPGIDISEELVGEERQRLLDAISNSQQIPKSLATVSLIPSERDEDKQLFIQGMEKFIGSMTGKTYTAVLLATPVEHNVLSVRRHGFEALYSQMSPHSKISMSFAHSETESVNESLSLSLSTSINQSVSDANGKSSSNTEGSSYSSGSSFGASGDGFSVSSNSSYSTSNSYTTGTSFSHTVSESTGKNKSSGINAGQGNSSGDTDTTSLTFENKSVQNLMERAESQLKRIDFSESYGMWDFCAYFFSDDAATTSQAVNVYKSLMLGHESSVERAHVNTWNLSHRSQIGKILEYVKHLRHPLAEIPAYEQYREQFVTPTNMINGKELPIVLGLPRKSVPGLAVVEMAEFGRAVVYESPERVHRRMEFGSIYHMGVKEALRVPMDIDMLASHCLITGSSGSGKSYATYQLLKCLLDNSVKMMIIEPAKGEYKQVFGG